MLVDHLCWWPTHAEWTIHAGGALVLVANSCWWTTCAVVNSCQEIRSAWAGHIKHCTLVSRQAQPVWEICQRESFKMLLRAGLAGYILQEKRELLHCLSLGVY